MANDFTEAALTEALQRLSAQGAASFIKTTHVNIPLALFVTPSHRKRDSKRRWKARIWRGQWVPWWAVVEHRLETYVGYEYDPIRDLVRIPPPVVRFERRIYGLEHALTRNDVVWYERNDPSDFTPRSL